MNNSSYTSGRTWKLEVWKQGDQRSQYLGKQGRAGPEGEMSRTRQKVTTGGEAELGVGDRECDRNG